MRYHDRWKFAVVCACWVAVIVIFGVATQYQFDQLAVCK